MLTWLTVSLERLKQFLIETKDWLDERSILTNRSNVYALTLFIILLIGALII
jgi:type IV secretory pathway component VirB8